MADTNSPQQIVQDVILNIKQNIQGQSQALRYLQSLQKSVNATQSAIKKQNVATTGANKALNGFRKTAFTVASALKALSKAVLIAAGAISSMIANFRKIMQTQKVFVEFIASVKGGINTLKSLQNVYQGIASSNKIMLISLRETAAALQEFSKLGFVQFNMSSTTGAQSALLQLQQSFAEAYGDKDIGKQYFDSITQAASQSIPHLTSVLNILKETGTDTPDKLRQVADVLMTLDANAMQVSEQLRNAAQAIKENTSGYTAMEKIVNQVSTAWVTLRDTVLDALGPVITATLKDIASWLEKMLNWVNLNKDTIIVYGTTVKVVFMNMVKIVKLAWDSLMLVAQTSVSVLSELGATALAAFGFDDAAQSLKAYSEESQKLEKQRLNSVLNPGFLNMDAEIAKARQEQEKMNKASQDAADAIKNQASAMDGLRDKMIKLNEDVQKLEIFEKILNNSSTAMGELSDLIKTAGPSYKVLGESISEYIHKISNAALESAYGKLSQANEAAMQNSLDVIEELQKQLNEAQYSGDKEKILQAEAAFQSAIQESVKLYRQKTQAIKTVAEAAEASTATEQANLSLSTKQRDVAESYLKIAQATYGTLGLSVQQQMAIVEQIEKQKSSVENMLAYYQSLPQAAKDQQNIQEKILELEKQRADLIAEQLNMVKELRDGYLDAVNAQAFGAGKFEKIIITQDRNIMRGLEKGIAKNSFLLGQYGKAAGAGTATALRFGTGGYGHLTTPSGGAATEGMLQGNINNISDPVQRGITQMANQLVMTDMSNTSKIVSADNRNTDRMINALSAIAGAGARSAAPLLGAKGRPGEILSGEAASQTMAPFLQSQNMPVNTGSTNYDPSESSRFNARKRSISAGSAAADGTGKSWHDKMKLVMRVLVPFAQEIDILLQEENDSVPIDRPTGGRAQNIPAVW